MQREPHATPLIDDTPVAGLPYRYVALSLVCLGIFLGTLDQSITNIALPTLADEFDTGIANVIWVSLIFILVTTGLGLTMGRLGDLYGRKHLYVVGFLLFTVATGASAIAGSSSMAFRWLALASSCSPCALRATPRPTSTRGCCA